MFIIAGSKPLNTVGFGPSAMKVVGDKNGHHHWLGPGFCYQPAVVRISRNSKIKPKKIANRKKNPEKPNQTTSSHAIFRARAVATSRTLLLKPASHTQLSLNSKYFLFYSF